MKNVTLILALSLALATVGVAQTTKPKPDNKATKGTVQMAGDNGKLNTTYTIGKEDSVNITVTSIRFSVSREIVGDNVISSNKDEKLLVIDFTAHNPNKTPLLFDGGALKFTGVDQESVNRPYTGYFTRAKTNEVFRTQLLPAQKVELRTVIIVPAVGTVPKLILEHRRGGPVLRIDTRPYLKPLDAVYADPEDETGMTALGTVKALNDVYYPITNMDIKLDTQELIKHGTRFGPNTLSDGKVYAFVKFTLKGMSPQAVLTRFDAEFVDEDGGRHRVVKWAPPSTEDHFNTKVGKGDEVGVRFVGAVPQNVKIKAIRVVDTSAKATRMYIFPVGKSE